MTYLLIDTSYLLYRSYFAYTNLTNSKNIPLGAVFGFIKSILTFQKHYNPDFVVFAKDLPGGTFRDQMYNAYKDGRLPTPPDLITQIELVNNWLADINAPVLGIPGYEADDMIASSVYQLITPKAQKILSPDGKEYRFEGRENWKIDNDNTVLIFTGDRDLYQLLDYPNVKMVISDKFGGTKILDYEGFKLKYELEPAQWLDYKALVGDASDNIKGATGIGPKTATTLLQDYGSLQAVYLKLGINFQELVGDNIPYYIHSTVALNENKELPVKIALKLKTDLEQVILAFKLSKLAFPVCEIPHNNLNFSGSSSSLFEWEFKSIIKELNLTKKTENDVQESLF